MYSIYVTPIHSGKTYGMENGALCRIILFLGKNVNLTFLYGSAFPIKHATHALPDV